MFRTLTVGLLAKCHAQEVVFLQHNSSCVYQMCEEMMVFQKSICNLTLYYLSCS